jgi:Tol biopolymer transport system component
MTINKKFFVCIITLIIITISLCGCTQNQDFTPDVKTVPHEKRWGIYSLDLTTYDTSLIYSYDREIEGLRINHQGDRFAFSQKFDGDNNSHREICTLKVDGTDFKRFTNNSDWDLYPAWSPDDTQIAFLSFRTDTLDLYIMDSDGNNISQLFDSGSHDADIHWVSNNIVFTSKSSIWMINDDGTEPKQITYPPKAGEWGTVNLPFGDYDPRLNPSGDKIIFSRLENDSSDYGNYNIFIINTDGTEETRLTDTGYSQGLTSWSNSRDKIVFIVAAIEDIGKYDIYMMNSDGTDYKNITPDFFPNNFLCHKAVFSNDDSKLFFIGEWWE